MIRLTFNAEPWILKLQSWFLVSQIECRLHNLHVVYISRMLCAQFSGTSDHVKCWEFKLFINFDCWNVSLKVGCYNLMLVAEVECWNLKFLEGIEHYSKPSEGRYMFSADSLEWSKALCKKYHSKFFWYQPLLSNISRLAIKGTKSAHGWNGK